MRTFGVIEIKQGPPRLDATAIEELHRKRDRDVHEDRMLDQQRLDQLEQHGFAGPSYDLFCDELWQYALPVLKSKIRTGEIFAMCFARNVILDPTSDERAVLHSSIEDRDALAVDAIMSAVTQFRTTLQEHRWKPTRGSSVNTYFIGACVLAFGDVFRSWARARRRHLDHILQNTGVDTLATQLISTALDPEHNAVTRHTVQTILGKCPPQTRLICALIMRDIPFSEIANYVGISERAVEGKMHRLRQRVRRMVEQGQIDHQRPSSREINVGAIVA